MNKVNEMNIYECQFETLERLFFASSEFGKEYKTKGIIGNTALPYAMSLIDVSYKQKQKPQHKKDFDILNKKGIYITPVTFYDINFVLDRFNSIVEGNDKYITINAKGKEMIHEKKDPADVMPNDRNYPNEGTFKLIGRGSKGIFYVLSNNEIDLPQYIRVGKFMSKCKIITKKIEFVKKKDVMCRIDIILRSEDIDPLYSIYEYTKILIQNGTYIQNTLIKGDFYHIKSKYFMKVNLPMNSKFYIAT